ncbi:MAG: hypothetical protein LBL74_07145 [Bacteroidales bacterium]|jgi:hypothetical protein|nr:hypothetical protein [Bacteroidales bacterium]
MRSINDDIRVKANLLLTGGDKRIVYRSYNKILLPFFLCFNFFISGFKNFFADFIEIKQGSMISMQRALKLFLIQMTILQEIK